MTPSSLKHLYGNIDIYLFDQLLKGNYDNCQKMIDVGCGGGRNLVYFLTHGFDVYGIDPNPDAINTVKSLVESLAPTHPLINFRVSSAEDMPFGEASFDLLICSAVLHFAENEMHFKEMLLAMWKVIKPGGFFFARLASAIGIEELISPSGNGRYRLPDGTERFLVSEQILLDYTKELNGYLYEPIKTTNVQNLRCMTTWCLQKL